MAKGFIKPVKGTRDFYPQDKVWQNWLYEKAKEASQAFGYQEYEGPILESFSLYSAKSAEEIIKNQSFIIPVKGRPVQDSLILRPELTPTLARMIAAREYELAFPVRWWSWGRFFRYEAPQRGRGREFYQWNIDLLGQDCPNADAETIAVGVWFLASLGLTAADVVIKVNDRKYLDDKFDLINIPQNSRLAIFRIIDKKDKVAAGDFEAMLIEAGLTKLQIKDLGLILKDYDYSQESPWLTELFSSLSDLGVGDWVEFDPTIVRGFDYYTDTVFEARTKNRQGRALFGGGRYQNLVNDVGGTRKIGGVGLAVGDMMVYEVLSDLGRLPVLSALPAKILMTVFNEETFRSSLLIVGRLRGLGVNIEMFLDYQTSLAKQLAYANKKGFSKVLIVGPEEKTSQEATVKDLVSGQQKRVKIKDLAVFLKD
ncbi:MAG: histidine--tRNA ligase [Candidatus Shapirobacteria bacterium]|nr:histidine--tRNA ligase [Candidatus Shapirobacteria bacterium]MDD5073757.1 histidine--tRNA ligase [Candidatus Shapirobacteria bacterium]MDD5481642.1 histidine--tRNA ligase [Candidatus Shapirobacteria bacterium]